MRITRVTKCSICGTDLSSKSLLKYKGSYYCDLHYNELKEEKRTLLMAKRNNEIREIVKASE